MANSVANPSPENKPGRGRPRDPDLENRVFETAIALYATGGWAAFSFEAIARNSGVGKSSIYRRWISREQLLVDTLQARWIPVHKIDTGYLQKDLRALAEMIFTNHTSELAGVERWFMIDASQHPEVRNAITPYKEATILQARTITRRAARRGEVSKSLNPGLLMDLVVGAVNNHVLTTPPHLKSAMLKKAPAFLDSLVDVVLRGVQAKPV